MGRAEQSGVPELQDSLACVSSGLHKAACARRPVLGLTCRQRRDVGTESLLLSLPTAVPWGVGLGVQGQKVKRSGQRPWGTEQRPLGQGATAGGRVWVCSWHMQEGLLLVQLVPPPCPLTASPKEGKSWQRRQAHPGSMTRDSSRQAGLLGTARGLVWAGGCLSPLALSFEQAAHCPLSRFYYYPSWRLRRRCPSGHGRLSWLRAGVCLAVWGADPAEGPKGAGFTPREQPWFRCLNRALSWALGPARARWNAQHAAHSAQASVSGSCQRRWVP